VIILEIFSEQGKEMRWIKIHKESEVTTGRSRKHSGTNRYRQGLPQ
jgi:hypothetical protein